MPATSDITGVANGLHSFTIDFGTATLADVESEVTVTIDSPANGAVNSAFTYSFDNNTGILTVDYTVDDDTQFDNLTVTFSRSGEADQTDNFSLTGTNF